MQSYRICFRAAVGSVTGIGGTAGASGGMAMAKYADFVLDNLNTYAPLFAAAGLAYFIALGCVQIPSLRFSKALVNERQDFTQAWFYRIHMEKWRPALSMEVNKVSGRTGTDERDRERVVMRR
jgi:ACS family hexuronate transporter-like MFS transporter